MSKSRTNKNGTTYWRNEHGQLHRTDGPAVEDADGSNRWYQNDKLHRTDGPALEFVDSTKFWYQNDKLHRTDGPAIELANGYKYWYINSKQLTEAEFNSPSYREFVQLIG